MVTIECIICGRVREMDGLTRDDIRAEGFAAPLIPGTLHVASLCPRCAFATCPECGKAYRDHDMVDGGGHG